MMWDGGWRMCIRWMMEDVNQMDDVGWMMEDVGWMMYDVGWMMEDV